MAARDPGVHNWLDTTGLRSGVILIRYDGMKDATFPAEKFPQAVRIKLADLNNYLPAGTPRVGPMERSKIIAERRRHVQLRFGN